MLITDITENKFQYELNKTDVINCGYIPVINTTCGLLNISVRSENQVGLSEPSYFLFDCKLKYFISIYCIYFFYIILF